MSTPAFTRRFLDTTASTKRNPAIADGKIGAAVTNLASLAITAPMLMDAELKEQYGLDMARRGWILYAASGSDVKAGDKITVASYFTDAMVKYVEIWPSDIAYVAIAVME